MAKLNAKKAAVIALAGLMMAQTALTGCGKKTVDYDLENNSGKGNGENSDINRFITALRNTQLSADSCSVRYSGIFTIALP